MLKVSFDEKYKADADFITAFASEQSKVSDKKIAVTLGVGALKTELESVDNISILALDLTSHEFNLAIEETHAKINGSRQISAVFMNADPILNVALADILSPNGKKYLPYSPTSQLHINSDLKDFLKSTGGVLQPLPLSDTQQMLHSMDIYEVLIAYPDESLFNQQTIKPIISSLYRRKKFMLGFSPSLTKAGALASISIDDENYKNQYLAILNEFYKNGRLPGLVYSSDFDITVNQVLAKALGFYSNDIDEKKLKEELLKIKFKLEYK